MDTEELEEKGLGRCKGGMYILYLFTSKYIVISS